jgi:hypothetical protein
MRSVSLGFLLLGAGLLHAQTSDIFEKAPPEVDTALRARVTAFYTAYETGHFRQAIPLVADDAQDDFLVADKNVMSECAIQKVNYKDNFAKAAVLTTCKGEMRFHGEKVKVTMPLTTYWKLVDGQWFWYTIPRTEMQTPWGLARVTPADNSGPMPEIPKDPNAAARAILGKVTIDGSAIDLNLYEKSSATVHVSNSMPGSINVIVEPYPMPGLKMKVESPELTSGGKTAIQFSYDPNDPSIACVSCGMHSEYSITAKVRIEPTAQVFPVKITFHPAPAAK